MEVLLFVATSEGTMQVMSSIVDTAKVAEHRVLHFTSLDQVRAEVDRLVAADAEGKLRCCGNWSLGQTLNHLAAWVEYSYTQPPMKTPWLVKVLIRLVVGKRRFIEQPMRRGVRIPGIAGGTLTTEPVSLEAGLVRYQAALDRIEREAPQKPNVLFGALTHEEWIKLQLRHAENHLGYAKAE